MANTKTDETELIRRRLFALAYHRDDQGLLRLRERVGKHARASGEPAGVSVLLEEFDRVAGEHRSGKEMKRYMLAAHILKDAVDAFEEEK